MKEYTAYVLYDNGKVLIYGPFEAETSNIQEITQLVEQAFESKSNGFVTIPWKDKVSVINLQKVSDITFEEKVVKADEN